MANFPEVLDEIQISSPTSNTEQQPQQQQRQANPTIISKFRNNFLPNTKHSLSRRKLFKKKVFRLLSNRTFFYCIDKLSLTSTTSKQSFSQPSQESTTGNQILLSTDDTAIPRVPPSSLTPSPVSPMRRKASTLVQDDAHV